MGLTTFDLIIAIPYAIKTRRCAVGPSCFVLFFAIYDEWITHRYFGETHVARSLLVKCGGYPPKIKHSALDKWNHGGTANRCGYLDLVPSSTRCRMEQIDAEREAAILVFSCVAVYSVCDFAMVSGAKIRGG